MKENEARHPGFFAMCGDLVAKIIKFGKPGEYGGTKDEMVNEDADLEDANLLTSLVTYARGTNDGKGIHKIVLDIDMPAMLIPSSTPGHHHLIIDRTLDWPVYVKLLDALAEAGIVEQAYVSVSKSKGYTAIRTPWTKKEDDKPKKKESKVMASGGVLRATSPTFILSGTTTASEMTLLTPPTITFTTPFDSNGNLTYTTTPVQGVRINGEPPTDNDPFAIVDNEPSEAVQNGDPF